MKKSFHHANGKQMNVDLVRSAIKSVPGNTKAGISAITGLSHATCNSILNELVSLGEVRELEKDTSSGGRPAQLYS